MKFKKYNNEKSLGYVISTITIFFISYLYLKNDEFSYLLSFILIANYIVTSFYPFILKPLSNALILLGEMIGKFVTPCVFFVIFVTLVVPIGIFYKSFIFKDYKDWIISSEGNDDDFENEF